MSRHFGIAWPLALITSLVIISCSDNTNSVYDSPPEVQVMEDVVVDNEIAPEPTPITKVEDIQDQRWRSSATEMYNRLLASLDQQNPGFGIESPNREKAESAMAYAHIAQSAALIGDTETMYHAADWLVENSSSGSATGWGLSFEWDAYSDGSTNPSTTVYGITTALAVGGLVDSYCQSGNANYLETAVKALDYFSLQVYEDDLGQFFAYSDQSSDAYNTHNVNAMLTHAYARVGLLTENETFLNLAENTLTTLKDAMTEVNGNITWRYTAPPESSSRSDRNDLVHAAYIAYGINETQKLLGFNLVPEESLRVYMDGFVHGGNPKEFRLSELRNSEEGERRARSWGLGMYIAWLSSIGDFDSASSLLETIEHYRTSTGSYEYVFGSAISLPRSTAHLMYGVATLAAGRDNLEIC
tara:strand:+ start:194 stop:1435 length:1242 start_codon:yes stop_codon:yes gene_type:complete